MTLTLTLDVVVAGLLVATIVYAIVLSRRLGALRNDKAQLEALVKSLDASARRAEAGVAALRAAAGEIGHELQQKLDQGKALRSDLGYVIELGGNLADRLEDRLRTARVEAKPAEDAEGARRPAASSEPAAAERRQAPPAGAADPEERQRVTGFPSRAERLLRRALEARN